MLRRGLAIQQLAERIGSSEKSIRRWLDGVSVPHPRTRYQVAAAVGEDEAYLWPQVADRAGLAGAELVASWPRRADVPRDLWVDLLRQSARAVDLLAFAGLFLTEEQPEWIPLLREKAAAGVQVRLLLGDLNGSHLPSRDGEYRIGGGVAGRVKAVMAHYRSLVDVVQIREHDTPLYNSIYRFDDEMLVNTHVYGILAAYTPVLRLRRVDGQYFETYLESFERVWARARPFDPSAVRRSSLRQDTVG
ncbi:MAG: helix-turn-helix transcriptional regulator [Actinomycetales bacterium]|nr:helix-turn-helix transcriptional regulator [Actinomycetales bacterium]